MFLFEMYSLIFLKEFPHNLHVSIHEVKTQSTIYLLKVKQFAVDFKIFKVTEAPSMLQMLSRQMKKVIET